MSQGKSFFVGKFLRYFFLIIFSFVFSLGTPSNHSSCGTCNVSHSVFYVDNYYDNNFDFTYNTFWGYDHNIVYNHLSCGGYNPPPLVDCKNCNGNINYLLLQYTGAKSTKVEIYTGCNKKIYSSVVAPMEFIDVKGSHHNDVLGSYIYIYIDGKYYTKIGNSCNKLVLKGSIYGVFTVRDGTRSNGREICTQPGYFDIGYVCGNIYEDKNLNGIKDTTETSKSEISVNIVDSRNNNHIVKTDEEGRYCAYNIASGLASVEVDTLTLPYGSQLVSGQNPNIITVMKNRTNDAGMDGYATLPPVAYDQNITTLEDNNVSLQLQVNDYGNKPLNYTIITQPLHGTLSGVGSKWIYTPNPNYNGSDSFTFKANNGLLDSNIATVNIAITPVNDAPIAFDDNATILED